MVFLPLQVGREKARPALTLIGYEDEIRPAMAYVFGSTFICDTMLDAKKVTSPRTMLQSIALLTIGLKCTSIVWLPETHKIL